MSIYIFVLLLENNRYFIHRSYNEINIDFQIFIEFEICYEFPKKYKPLQILEIIPEENSFHLDYIVKKYMMKYGIENVRGGSYSETNLSKKQNDILQLELDSASNYEDYKEVYGYIIKNYVENKWSSETDILKEISRLNDLLTEYSQNKEKMKSFITINKSIKEEFDWLRDICKTIHSDYENGYKYENKKKYNKYYKDTILWQKQNIPIIQRYTNLLETCKYIHRIYKTEFYEDTIHHIYFKHPEFLLDTFFLHKYQIDSVKMCEVGTFCDMMLFMTEKIIERIQNLKHEEKIKFLEIPHIEWCIPKIIYVLECTLQAKHL